MVELRQRNMLQLAVLSGVEWGHISIDLFCGFSCPRYNVPMAIRGWVSLFLVVAIIALSACGGGDSSPSSPASGGPAPTLAEMELMLQAEFDRLGIDPDKVPAGVPQGAENGVFDLELEVIDPDGEGGDPPTGVELTWTERMIADYDQNGLITAGDLTPLGIHYKKTIDYDDPSLHGGNDYWPAGNPDDDGSGTENWRLARIDGNGDGWLEVSDITPLALQWNARMSGYVIERAVNQGTGQWIFDAEYVDIGYGTLPSVPRSVNFLPGEMSVDPNKPVRYSVTVPMADTGNAQLFRVRAHDDATAETGSPSNSTIYLPTITTDTTPPVWVDTIGVTNLIPAPNQLTVEFGTAEDSQSPPVTYRVYWADGDPGNPDAPFDYDIASYEDVTFDPHIITGLTDGQFYRVAVRATDSADTPNMELNDVVMGREAGAADIYPPEWVNEPGITFAMMADGKVIVAFGAAIDSHTDEHGTWESGPVIYRIYHGPGHEPDWDNAEVVERTDTGLDKYLAEFDGVDTTSPRWFAVRVIDQADPRNEDDNETFFVAPGIAINRQPIPEPGPSITLTSYMGTCWFLRHPDYDGVGLLRVFDGRDENVYETEASFYRWDGDEFQHVADYPEITSIRLTARLTGNGNLVLAYAERTGATCDGKLHFNNTETGESYAYDFTPKSIELVTLDGDLDPFVLLTESISVFPSVIKQYFSHSPFDEYVELSQIEQSSPFGLWHHVAGDRRDSRGSYWLADADHYQFYLSRNNSELPAQEYLRIAFDTGIVSVEHPYDDTELHLYPRSVLGMFTDHPVIFMSRLFNDFPNETEKYIYGTLSRPLDLPNILSSDGSLNFFDYTNELHSVSHIMSFGRYETSNYIEASGSNTLGRIQVFVESESNALYIPQSLTMDNFEYIHNGEDTYLLREKNSNTSQEYISEYVIVQ